MIKVNCDQFEGEVFVDPKKLGENQDTFVYGPDGLEYIYISREKLELISILEEISTRLSGYYHEKGVVESILAYIKYSAIKLRKVDIKNWPKHKLEHLLEVFGIPKEFVKMVSDNRMLSKLTR